MNCPFTKQVSRGILSFRNRHSPSKLMMMLLQVQIMLRKSGKGGAGVRSVQVASDSSLGEQFIMREEREIR